VPPAIGCASEKLSAIGAGPPWRIDDAVAFAEHAVADHAQIGEVGLDLAGSN
jgi:hypothetical protein